MVIVCLFKASGIKMSIHVQYMYIDLTALLTIFVAICRHLLLLFSIFTHGT